MGIETKGQFQTVDDYKYNVGDVLTYRNGAKIMILARFATRNNGICYVRSWENDFYEYYCGVIEEETLDRYYDPEQLEPETIEIDGKKYKREDVLERLKELESIN